MTFDDLTAEQKLELKQRILTERNEHLGEGTSYGELADADELVSDEDLEAWYGGTEFSPDDFSCTASAPVEKVENVPQWAVSYLVNNDDSGITPEEAGMVEDFVEKLDAEGLELLCPIDGSENEFCSAPAFGLACGTVDFAARRTCPKRGEQSAERSFEVRVTWPVGKTYEVRARSEGEAVAKLKAKVDAGEVCVWTDGFETEDEVTVEAVGEG